jgi:hypothetical protein
MDKPIPQFKITTSAITPILPQLDWVSTLHQFKSTLFQKLQLTQWRATCRSLHSLDYNPAELHTPENLRFTHPVPLNGVDFDVYYQLVSEIPRMNINNKPQQQLIHDLHNWLTANGALIDPRIECRPVDNNTNPDNNYNLQLARPTNINTSSNINIKNNVNDDNISIDIGNIDATDFKENFETGQNNTDARTSTTKSINSGAWGIFATENIPAFTTIGIIPYGLSLNSSDWQENNNNNNPTKIMHLGPMNATNLTINNPKHNTLSILQLLPIDILQKPELSLPIRFFIELCHYSNSFYQFYFDSLPKFTLSSIHLESVQHQPLSNFSSDSKSTLVFVKDDEYVLFEQLRELIQQYLPLTLTNNQQYNWETHKYITSILNSRSLLTTNTNLIKPVHQRATLKQPNNTNQNTTNTGDLTPTTTSTTNNSSTLTTSNSFETNTIEINVVEDNEDPDWDPVLIPFFDMINHSSYPNIAQFTLPYNPSNNQLPSQNDLTTETFVGGENTGFYFISTSLIEKGDELTLDYIGSIPYQFPMLGPVNGETLAILSENDHLTPLHVALKKLPTEQNEQNEQNEKNPQNDEAAQTQQNQKFGNNQQIKSRPQTSTKTTSTKSNSKNPTTTQPKTQKNLIKSKPKPNKYTEFFNRLHKSNPLSNTSINKLLQSSLCRYPLLTQSDLALQQQSPHKSFFNYNILPHGQFHPYNLDNGSIDGWDRYFIHIWLFSDFTILQQIMTKSREYYQQALKSLEWDYIAMDDEYLHAFQTKLNEFGPKTQATKTNIDKNVKNSTTTQQGTKSGETFIPIAPLPFDSQIAQWDPTMTKFLSNCLLELQRCRYETIPNEITKRYETVELFRHELQHRQFLRDNDLVRTPGNNNPTMTIHTRGDSMSIAQLQSTLSQLQVNDQTTQQNRAQITTDLTPDTTILLSILTPSNATDNNQTNNHIDNQPNPNPTAKPTMGIDFNYERLDNGGFNTEFIPPEDQQQAMVYLYPYSFSLTTISPPLQSLCYYLASLAQGCPTELIPLLFQNCHYIRDVETLRLYSVNYYRYFESFFQNDSNDDNDNIMRQFELLHLPARCILLAIVSTLIELQQPNINHNNINNSISTTHNKSGVRNTTDPDKKTHNGDIQFSSFLPLTHRELQLQSDSQSELIKVYENVPNYVAQHIFNVIATSIGVKNEYWDLKSIPNYKSRNSKLPTNLNGPGVELDYPPPHPDDTVVETPVSHFGWWRPPGIVVNGDGFQNFHQIQKL